MKLRAFGLMMACGIALAACAKEAPQSETKAPDQAAKAQAPAEAEKAVADAKPAVDAGDPNTMKISVPAIQCETCAATITKGVKTLSEAQDVKVDVDTKTVFVKVANNTPETRAKIEAAIAKVGYSTANVKRDAKAYDGLPDCCKEGGEKKEM